MAATADPRAKPPTAHHLKPWVPTPTPRAHRVPSLPAVSGGSGGAKPARDRRRSSSSSFHRRRNGTDAGAVDEEEEEEEEVEVVEGFDSGLEDLRAKLMGHIKDVADRFHLPQPKSQPRSPDPEPPAPPLPPPPPPPPDTSAATAARPWNLRERKRRSSARGSTAASPTTAWAARRAETARGGGERAPFAVALAAEEIEEDIYALTGGRPRRRPRKRPRVVQRQLDSLFPGLWLTEITADAYKVPDD